MTPTAQQDATIAARIPLELRTALEAKRDELIAAGQHYPDGRPVDLSYVIRQAVRAYCDDAAVAASLFGANGTGAARRRDRPTSRAAAMDVAPRVGSQRRKALEVIADRRYGATADEVIAVMERIARDHGGRVAVNGVARRVTDLVQAGAIVELRVRGGSAGAEVDTNGADPNRYHHGRSLFGEEDHLDGVLVRPTRNGSAATVYGATPKGLRWLQETKP